MTQSACHSLIQIPEPVEEGTRRGRAVAEHLQRGHAVGLGDAIENEVLAQGKGRGVRIRYRWQRWNAVVPDACELFDMLALAAQDHHERGARRNETLRGAGWQMLHLLLPVTPM
jgi:hypothetical protein